MFAFKNNYSSWSDYLFIEIQSNSLQNNDFLERKNNRILLRFSLWKSTADRPDFYEDCPDLPSTERSWKKRQAHEGIIVDIFSVFWEAFLSTVWTKRSWWWDKRFLPRAKVSGMNRHTNTQQTVRKRQRIQNLAMLQSTKTLFFLYKVKYYKAKLSRGKMRLKIQLW